MKASAPDSAPSQRQLERRLWLAVGLGLAVYAALALYSDAPALAQALTQFDLRWLGFACTLSFANYIVRFARWELYRRRLGIQLGLQDSLLIHLSGFVLTVSPGKMGEAFKSWLVREVDGTPLSRSAPIVVAERLTDLCAFLILIALGGLQSAPDYAWIFWSTLGLCGLLLLLISSRASAAWSCKLVARLPLVGKQAPRVEVFLDSARILLSPRFLILPILLATIGWSLECVAFWQIANAFVEGSPISLAFAGYGFALSAVAGAIVILFPGGLGITEGVLTALLSARYKGLGVDGALAQANAGAATILIRLATLWFAVLVGFAAYALFRRSRRAVKPAQAP